MLTKIRKFGEDFVFLIPNNLIDEHNLKEGDELTFWIDNGKINLII